MIRAIINRAREWFANLGTQEKSKKYEPVLSFPALAEFLVAEPTNPKCREAAGIIDYLLDTLKEFAEAAQESLKFPNREDNPTRFHAFADGLYVQETNSLGETSDPGKAYKAKHLFFFLTGSAQMQTANGPVEIIAPMWGVVQANTKCPIYFYEDTNWITIHATDETDIGTIEDELTVCGKDS